MNAPQIVPGKRTNAPAASPTAGHILQRACACGQHTGGGGECESCKKKRQALQRAAVHDGRGSPDVAPPIVHEVLRSPGRPLEAGTRAAMESRFGLMSGKPHIQDFSHVHVHTDAKAARSAQAVNALAYTVGPHIVFGEGRYAPNTYEGQRLIRHEFTHVLQQSLATGSLPAEIAVGAANDRYERAADRAASTSLMPSAAETAGAPVAGAVLQRQEAAPVHASPPGARSRPSNFEKWGPDVERMYRRAGLDDAANAVRRCREQGACDRLLTEREAWEWYRSGRSVAGLEDPGQSGAQPAAAGAPVAAGTLAARAAGSGAASATESALARAAARWGTAAVIEGGASTTAATGAATGTAAATATVAVPVAVGVVLVFAIIDLVSWGRFQSALQSKGYVILPNPLGVCIGSCHQPTRPAAPTFPTFEEFEPLPPPSFTDIERWLRESGPSGGRTQPSPGPGPSPAPFPQPDPRRRDRENCFQLNPGALPCTDPRDRDEVVVDFLMNQGYPFDALGDCRGVGSFAPGAIDACAGAPGERWHCRVNGTINEVSVFGCLCCDENGSTGFEWRGPHWSIHLGSGR